MEFEWDEKKNELNLVKHGFDFVNAQFFFDQPALSWIDKRRDYSEQRFIGLGKLKDEVVVFVYTMRRENICRAISLRKAGKNEKRKYYTWLKNHEK